MRKVRIYDRHPDIPEHQLSPFFGYFHKWGKDFEEFESGAVEMTVAIVELENGRIWKLDPNLIQFMVEDD